MYLELFFITLSCGILLHSIHISLQYSSSNDLYPFYYFLLTQYFLYCMFVYFFSSVQFSCSLVSESLQPHGLQHTRLPCPSQHLEIVQTPVHWVGDAIQPSDPLSSPSPPAFNLSQHQSPFQYVSSSHQVAKILELQLQQQSFQWIFWTDFF